MVHTALWMAEGGQSLPSGYNGSGSVDPSWYGSVDLELSNNQQEDINSKRGPHGHVELWEHLRSKNTLLAYWRRGLKEVLKDYEFDEAEGKTFLTFLLSTFRFGIITAKTSGLGGTVKIMCNLAPNRLNLVSWRRILVGMNLVLEEPDTNNDIEMIGVSLSHKMNTEILPEFCRLLELIKDCNWQVLQTILDMPEGYHVALIEILEHCREAGTIQESKQKNVRILYEIDMFSMRFIGFYRANPTEPVSWQRPQNDSHLTVISILYGLYGSLIRHSSVSGFQSLPQI